MCVYMYIMVVCEYTYNYVMQVCFILEVMCVERERERDREREKERCSILFTSLFTALSFFLSFLFFLPKTGDFLEAANRSRGENGAK